MNGQLYGLLNGRECVPGADHVDLTPEIEALGGQVVEKRAQPWTSGTYMQYHVIVDGDLWFLVPNRVHGYAWLLNRKGCTCGKGICECSTPEAQERRAKYHARQEASR